MLYCDWINVADFNLVSLSQMIPGLDKAIGYHQESVKAELTEKHFWTVP